MVETGDVLAGKYRIEAILGSGGMGYVVSAVHEQLGQRVAVKFMMPELCEQEEPVTRFLREARAAVRIRNEHVARVLDVGTLEDGAPYMVMEYLDGGDLADEIDRQGQLSIDVAVDYLLQAAEAIAEAHALGIVHRDLKPANLFLTRRVDGSPLIKVLDFGISKAVLAEDGHPAQSITATQALIGSPQYMSPEQVRKPKTVDGRADVWALGVILYELITGKQPFIAENTMSVLAAVVSDPTPDLREHLPGVDPRLQGIIEKCLAKNPDHRFQSVAELALALEPFAPAQSVSSIQRISGTLRSSLTPQRISRDVATAAMALGGGDLPSAETIQATPTSVPRIEAISADSSRAESHTAAEWGRSTKPGELKNLRLRRLGIAGAVLVVSAVGITAVVMRSSSTTIAPDRSASQEPVVSSAPVLDMAPIPSAVDSVASPPASASAEPPASASEEAIKPKPPQPVVVRHPPKPPKPKESAKPPASSKPPAAPTGIDPLDGRR